MRHRNFSPNCSKPPKIPRYAKVWDFRNIWRTTAHLRFFSFYTRWWWKVRVWPNGSSAEWALLGGDFLEDIKSQSGITATESHIKRTLKGHTLTLCPQLSVGESMTFEDCGSALIASDPSWTNVLLTLGRFTVYWHAHCHIGPKRQTTNGFEAPYRCSIKWFLYDYYDFAWWVIVASIPEALDLGWPFHIYSRWTTRKQGIVVCGTSLATGTGSGTSTTVTIPYTITGNISVDNDCDGQQASIPDQVMVKTRLNDAQGGGLDGEMTVSLTPDPDQPNNPRKIGTYSVTVQWDPAQGNPVDWNTPVAVRHNRSRVCSSIDCDSGQCLNMVTRTRTQPFSNPTSHYELRVFCSCIGP